MLNKDQEVRDPVSGDSYPMSYNDIKALSVARSMQKKQAASDDSIANMLTSILK